MTSQAVLLRLADHHDGHHLYYIDNSPSEMETVVDMTSFTTDERSFLLFFFWLGRVVIVVQ